MAWSWRGLALLGLAAALTATMSAPAFPQPGAVAAAVAGGPRATVGVPFALRMGARAEIAGTGWVSFAAVLDDSRCPIDVLCVWGGLARIRLEVGWIDSGGVAHLDAIEIDTIGLTAGAAGPAPGREAGAGIDGRPRPGRLRGSPSDRSGRGQGAVATGGVVPVGFRYASFRRSRTAPTPSTARA